MTISWRGPSGGLFFGHFSDRMGRKPMLVATLLLVGGGTLLIGLLPTYASIGIWAPVVLLIRLVQGFGAGAEYGGAVIMAVEFAPPGKRGLYGSFAPLGVAFSNLLAAGVFYLVAMMSKDDLLTWGWRIPFLVSLLLLGRGVFIGARMTETPVFTEPNAKRPALREPAIEALRRHPRSFFVVAGARLAENARWGRRPDSPGRHRRRSCQARYRRDASADRAGQGGYARRYPEIEFTDIIPQPTGFTAIIPGLSFLRDVMTEPFVAHWQIKDNCATSAQLPGVRIPGAPFMGVSAVAPSAKQLMAWTAREQRLIDRGGFACHRIWPVRCSPDLAAWPVCARCRRAKTAAILT
jgi:hypothetical protein